MSTTRQSGKESLKVRFEVEVLYAGEQDIGETNYSGKTRTKGLQYKTVKILNIDPDIIRMSSGWKASSLLRCPFEPVEMVWDRRQLSSYLSWTMTPVSSNTELRSSSGEN